MNPTSQHTEAVSNDVDVNVLMGTAVTFVTEYLKSNPVPYTEVPAFLRGVFAVMTGNAVASLSSAATLASEDDTSALSSVAVLEDEAVAAEATAIEEVAVAPALSNVPVIPVSESVQPDGIVCLFDGVKKLMIKRHLRARYGMEWNEYLAHFGLPEDYPSVAPGYSKEKSRFAISQGLGSKIDKTPRHLRVAANNTAESTELVAQAA